MNVNKCVPYYDSIVNVAFESKVVRFVRLYAVQLISERQVINMDCLQKFNLPADIDSKADEYFISCASGSVPPTLSGLALALGFSSRTALLGFNASPEIMFALERAKSRVENYTEALLYSRDGVRGAELSLRTNFGWGKDEKDSASPDFGKIEVLVNGLLSNADET